MLLQFIPSVVAVSLLKKVGHIVDLADNLAFVQFSTYNSENQFLHESEKTELVGG